MSVVTDRIEEATALVAAGDERKALEILHAIVEETDDPELLHEVRELATMAHESSHGLHRIEWHRLMIDTEH